MTSRTGSGSDHPDVGVVNEHKGCPVVGQLLLREVIPVSTGDVEW